jgi:hypothetical protein
MIWIRILWPVLISGCLILLTAPPTRAQSLTDTTSLFEFRGRGEPTVRIALAESALCAANQETQDLLCDDDRLELDFDRFMAWQTRFQPQNRVDSDLCRADVTIVQSLRRCEYGTSRDIDMLSAFMNNLAQDWRHRGDNERARELFRGAASLLGRVSPEFSSRSFVLRNWAMFEFEKGNMGVAASIADRWVDAARYTYRRRPDELRDLLTALRTRAQILDRLGDKVGSRAAATEAEQLAALPEISKCWVARTGLVECGIGEFDLITRCKTDVLGELRCYSERKR